MLHLKMSERNKSFNFAGRLRKTTPQGFSLWKVTFPISIGKDRLPTTNFWRGKLAVKLQGRILSPIIMEVENYFVPKILTLNERKEKILETSHVPRDPSLWEVLQASELAQVPMAWSYHHLRGICSKHQTVASPRVCVWVKRKADLLTWKISSQNCWHEDVKLK